MLIWSLSSWVITEARLLGIQLKSRKETVNVELKMDDMGIFKGKIDIGKGNTLLKIFFSVSSISFGILKSVFLFYLKIFQNQKIIFNNSSL